jgi:C4-dicarboxylate transporter
MFRGAFWCNAGMFVVGPLIAVAYELQKIVNGTDTFLDAVSHGFFMVVWLVLAGPGLVGLAVFGAIAGAVSFFRFGGRAINLKRHTIACALIADVIVGISGSLLMWLIRN